MDGEVGGIKNLLSTFNLAPDGILLSKSECILNLQEGFIHEWEKQLWSATRKMGGNKLRLYREVKSTFARENYILSWVTIRAHRIALASIEKMKLILASTNKNIVCEAASYTSLEEISCYRCHKATLSRKQVKIMINSIPAMFPHSLQLHYLLQPQLCWEQIVLVTVKGYFIHRWMGHLGLSLSTKFIIINYRENLPVRMTGLACSHSPIIILLLFIPLIWSIMRCCLKSFERGLPLPVLVIMVS